MNKLVSFSILNQKGTNIVVIDPELTKDFPNAKVVSDTLHAVLQNHKQSAS